MFSLELPKLLSMQKSVPLLIQLVKISAFWCVSNLGYYLVLPAFGIDTHYNTAPIAIGVYFFLWSIFAIVYFWNLFAEWLVVDSRIWVELLQAVIFSVATWTLLFFFSHAPAILVSPEISSYPDILFATPWYFLPKSTEVLLQQVLIVVSVITFSRAFGSFHKTIVAYAIFFGGAHILLFLLIDMPAPYARTMTWAAFATTLFFPYLILKVRSGFLYTYMIHLLFYIFFAMAINAWPPPLYDVQKLTPLLPATTQSK